MRTSLVSTMLPTLVLITMIGVPMAAWSGPKRLLVMPTAARGKVPTVHQRRIQSELRRVLSFRPTVKVTKDSDRPQAKGRADSLKARKSTRLERQIEAADKLRLAGMDQMKASPKKAYATFKRAIKLYESAAPELVDMTKLADAYARAAVASHWSHAGPGNVKSWFNKGLALQPTLVINRRGQSKQLLALFDRAVTKMKKQKKVGIEVLGNAKGATVFVDGVKVGGLPGRKLNLNPGTHVVQVRGPGHKPWGRVVTVLRTMFTVRARPEPIKTKGPKAVVYLTFDDLQGCADSGDFFAKGCRRQIVHMLRQTDSDYALFSLVKADRYGRLALHGYLATRPPKRRRNINVVALPSVTLAKGLFDLNGKLATFAERVTKVCGSYPYNRSLSRKPRAYKGK